ncbi:MAG: prepilin-type cleavage/methylation domain-containing protein [Candidatus Accumulibacter sp.]|nr:prepilin-type cleavage/methylation domain-containing protein [Accumulibacter sp.]
MIRARILPAIQGLSSRQAQMEQCYQDNHTYAPDPPPTAGPCFRACNTEVADHFEFKCDPEPTATTFTLTATGQDMMNGFVYTVNQTDARKSSVGSPAPSGWLSSEKSCWITSKGGAC